ncbi:hypothetical protein ACQKDY_09680 [Alteromonas macleodii]|uniref:hypothetical protein n=1 Tax=Alteromonas macleodii TaxID=28108 RepID=UPI003CFDF49F
MSEIKVGDTVKRIAGVHCGMKVGDTGTVTYFDDGINLKEFRGLHDEANFELVTQQKTVADAHEPYFKATRENLEKIAKDAQGDFVEVEEGEKWTHTYFNIRCRIMDLDPDEFGTVVIIKNGGDYALAHPSKLKPIKPTISEDSKRQLELYVQYRVDKYGDHAMKSDLSDYLSYHDIVGVSAND